MTIECVSGGIDEGEEPLDAARRELQEEIGLKAADWRHLGTVDPFTSSLASPTQIYLARTLTPVEAAPEGTELIRRVKLPFAEALQMVFDNQITHAPSCVVILKAAAVLGHRFSF